MEALCSREWDQGVPKRERRNGLIGPTSSEEPVKIIQRVKMAHSFLQSVSNQFHFIILSLPM